MVSRVHFLCLTCFIFVSCFNAMDDAELSDNDDETECHYYLTEDLQQNLDDWVVFRCEPQLISKKIAQKVQKLYDRVLDPTIRDYVGVLKEQTYIIQCMLARECFDEYERLQQLHSSEQFNNGEQKSSSPAPEQAYIDDSNFSLFCDSPICFFHKIDDVSNQ